MARIKIIKKAGERGWALPNSYRPISLLPAAGKLYERLIKAILTEHIYSNSLISENQFDFRPKHNTTKAITRVKDIAINSHHNSYVAAIMIDIKGTFASLWWPEVFQNLNRITISKTMFNTIKSYLSK